MICQICKKGFKDFLSLRIHLWNKHKISSKSYYDKYLKKDGEGRCKICGSETTYQGLGKGYSQFCSSLCFGKSLEKEKFKKICKFCNCEFDTYIKDAKFCSKICFRKYQKTQSLSIKKCEYCGKEFEYKIHKGRERMFCSSSCASKARRRRNFRKCICEYCGKDFETYERNAKFCCRDCYSKSKIGKPAWNKGIPRDDEWKKKFSDAKIKNWKDSEYRIMMYDAGNNFLNPPDRKAICSKGGIKAQELHPEIRIQGTKNILVFGKPFRFNQENDSGENHWNWKGGISGEKFKDRYEITIGEWKILSKKVRERDKYICQYCGKYRAIEVHHIIPARLGVNNSFDNLITLCRSCHKKIEHLTNKYLDENKNPIEIFYEKWSNG